MFAYLMMQRYPEWRALQKEQRRFIWESGFHPCLTTKLILGMKGLLLVLAICSAGWLGLMEHPGTSLEAIVAAVLIPGDLIDLFVIARNRHDIRDLTVRESCQSESVS